MVKDGPDTQLLFGADVEDWPSAKAFSVHGDNSFGYPIEALSALPAGTYYVQAMLHHYETFRRADGHTVKLPMDRGEGQTSASPPAIGTASRCALP
ncbi:MAG: hypothetical protein HC912_09705 [Saprospiraceae bacterium]|nr:hypothetical protein [Saprospiraceae bacterium]